MKQVTDNTIIGSDEFQIHVQTFMNLHIWSFIANNNDKILDLKYELQSLTDSGHSEMKLVIGPEYPYPLMDELYLYELLEIHRTLTVIIVENPSRAIPKRVLIHYEDMNTKDLNLTEIEEKDIHYIRHWLFLPDHVSWRWNSIQLSWDHPFFCDILNEITVGLQSMSSVISRVIFPTKCYITGESELDQKKLKELRYFYKKLEEQRLFHTISLYVSPGLLGNDTQDYMMLTKENMERVDLVLSSLIWENRRYCHNTLYLLGRERDYF